MIGVLINGKFEHIDTYRGRQYEETEEDSQLQAKERSLTQILTSQSLERHFDLEFPASRIVNKFLLTHQACGSLIWQLW